MKTNAWMIAVALCAAAACTLNLESVTTELHTEYDGTDWHTLRVSGPGMDGGIIVRGAARTGAEAVAVAETLVLAGSRPGVLEALELRLAPGHDGVLELSADCDDCSDGATEGVWLRQVEAELDAGADLDLETLSGDIDVSAVRGQVRASTASGDLSLQSTGCVRARTLSGHAGVTALCGSVRTASGRIDAVFTETAQIISASGHVDARLALGGSVETTSGGVEITLADADFESLQVDTNSGDVTVHLTPGADVDLELRSGSGSIDIDAGGLRLSTDDEYVGRIGAGGPSIRIATDSGDIEVQD